MRSLASIKLVDDVLSIDGADKIEKAVIGGWNVVIGKGQIKKGDKVVYFEIDSALPLDDKRYEFLHERCLKRWMNHGKLVLETVRIRTIKLRGVISQGLIMPIDEFPELDRMDVDTDVTEILKIEHYEELAEKCGRVQGVSKIPENAKGNFPSHLVPKTDSPRLQSNMDFFEKYKNESFQISEKADGSSVTFAYAPLARPDDPFYVCSRNLELKDEAGNIFWEMARKYNVMEKLKKHCEEWNDTRHTHQAAIQCELVGPGVNKNRDQFEEHQLRGFQMYDITNREYYDPSTALCIIEEMDIPHVKVVESEALVFHKYNSMEEFLELVRGNTDRGHTREGFVFKCVRNAGINFKVINNDYLLKEK